MLRVLVVAALAMTTLAGCADEGATQTTDPQDAPVALPGAIDAPQVDAAALLADLAHFASTFNERAANTPDHENARQWILDQFAGFGLETYRQNFTAGGLDQANLLGIKWGHVRDQWVVVGGHYDMTHDDCLVGGPCVARDLSQGAYDNGSGTLLTVHLAKAFAELDTYYTLVFVPFDGEERGTQGARAFVNAFVTGNGEGDFSSQPYGPIKVAGVVNLDMIGLNWPGVNAPLNVMTNSEAMYGETLNVTGRLGFPDGQVIRKDSLQLGSSDYARFWEVTEEMGGPIPTVFYISDFEEIGAPAPAPSQAHTPTPVGVYPFWHLIDTMETMTLMAGGAENVQAGFQAAADIAAHMLAKLADPGFAPDAVVM